MAYLSALSLYSAEEKMRCKFKMKSEENKRIIKENIKGHEYEGMEKSLIL